MLEIDLICVYAFSNRYLIQRVVYKICVMELRGF